MPKTTKPKPTVRLGANLAHSEAVAYHERRIKKFSKWGDMHPTTIEQIEYAARIDENEAAIKWIHGSTKRAKNRPGGK